MQRLGTTRTAVRVCDLAPGRTSKRVARSRSPIAALSTRHSEEGAGARALFSREPLC